MSEKQAVRKPGRYYVARTQKREDGATVWIISGTAPSGKAVSAGYVVTRDSKSHPGQQRLLEVRIDTGARCTDHAGFDGRVRAVQRALESRQS